MTVCRTCGLDHDRLGLRIEGRLLIRRVHGAKHRLRVDGGAFGFSAVFWRAHRSEFDELLIRDQASGEVFFGDARALKEVGFMCLNLRFGEQAIVPIFILSRTRTRPRISTSTDPEPARSPQQLPLSPAIDPQRSQPRRSPAPTHPERATIINTPKEVPWTKSK